jgi:hypothetical protein
MKQIFQKAFQSERGIALLFALSMLALLLVMALAFTSNSMMSAKVASNSSRTTASRLFAESALQQVKKAVSIYNDTLRCSKGTVDTLTGTNKSTSDMLEHLTTYDGTVPLFEWKDAFKSYISWQYITSNNKLIGRYAFVVLPSYGLDANYLCNSSVDEAGYNETRIGNEYSEINVRSVNDSVITIGIADKFNRVGTTAGGTQPAAGWGDFPTMFDSAHLNITASFTRANFMKWFVIGTGKQTERIWFDVNNDKLQDSGDKYYHRFNIARPSNQLIQLGYGYPPTDMYDKILLDSDGDGVPDREPLTFSGGANNGEGIPWLAFAGYKADVTGTIDADWGNTFGKTNAGVIARRRQIAANFIDYSDTGNWSPSPPLLPLGRVPTSDVDPRTWPTAVTAPTFTGNEKTAYINEIVIDVSYGVITTSPSAGHYNHTLTTEVKVSAEIIDIYNWSHSYKIKIYGSGMTGADLPISSTGTGYVASSYSSNISSMTTSNNNPTASFNIGGNTVVLNKAILMDNISGTEWGVDFVNFNGYAVTFPSRTINGDVQYFMSKTLSCKDPRQNLNAGGDDLDWKNNIPVGEDSALLSTAQSNAQVTLNASNYHCDPLYAYTSLGATKADKETSPDQSAVSTAYIRNGVILSPWELGFISRGAPYQTINLTEYDPNKAIKYVAGSPVILPGAGQFSDTGHGGGDANILDQIKLTPSSSNKKVNINTQYTLNGKNFVLRALLNKINVNSGINATMTRLSMATGGTLVSNLDDLAGAISNRLTDIDYLTRAAVVNCKKSGSSSFALSDGACGVTQDTNAKQEELIGKFINLTAVSGKAEFFTVIILAQTIKDVGNAKIRLNGTFKTTAFGQFDFVHTLIPDRYFYADKITSEQKIKVMFRVDSSGNCKILRYEYVE